MLRLARWGLLLLRGPAGPHAPGHCLRCGVQAARPRRPHTLVISAAVFGTHTPAVRGALRPGAVFGSVSRAQMRR